MDLKAKWVDLSSLGNFVDDARAGFDKRRKDNQTTKSMEKTNPKEFQRREAELRELDEEVKKEEEDYRFAIIDFLLQNDPEMLVETTKLPRDLKSSANTILGLIYEIMFPASATSPLTGQKDYMYIRAQYTKRMDANPQKSAFAGQIKEDDLKDKEPAEAIAFVKSVISSRQAPRSKNNTNDAAEEAKRQRDKEAADRVRREQEEEKRQLEQSQRDAEAKRLELEKSVREAREKRAREEKEQRERERLAEEREKREKSKDDVIAVESRAIVELVNHMQVEKGPGGEPLLSKEALESIGRESERCAKALAAEEALKEENTRLRNEITRLGEESRGVRGRYEEETRLKQEQIRELTGANESLRRQQSETADKRLAGVQEELTKERASKAILSNDVDIMTASLKKANAAKKQAEVSAASALKKLEKSQAETKELKGERDQLNGRIQALENQSNKLITDASNGVSGSEALVSQIKRQREELERLTNEKTELEKRLGKAGERDIEAANLATRVETLERENDTLIAERDDLAGRLKTAEGNSITVLAESATLQRQRDDLQTQLDTLRRNYQALETTAKSSTDTSASLGRLQREIEETRRQMIEAELKVPNLEASIEELRKENERLAGMVRIVDTIPGKIADGSAAISVEELRQQLSDAAYLENQKDLDRLDELESYMNQLKAYRLDIDMRFVETGFNLKNDNIIMTAEEFKRIEVHWSIYRNIVVRPRNGIMSRLYDVIGARRLVAPVPDRVTSPDLARDEQGGFTYELISEAHDIMVASRARSGGGATPTERTGNYGATLSRALSLGDHVEQQQLQALPSGLAGNSRVTVVFKDYEGAPVLGFVADRLYAHPVAGGGRVLVIDMALTSDVVGGLTFTTATPMGYNIVESVGSVEVTHEEASRATSRVKYDFAIDPPAVTDPSYAFGVEMITDYDDGTQLLTSYVARGLVAVKKLVVSYDRIVSGGDVDGERVATPSVGQEEEEQREETSTTDSSSTDRTKSMIRAASPLGCDHHCERDDGGDCDENSIYEIPSDSSTLTSALSDDDDELGDEYLDWK